MTRKELHILTPTLRWCKDGLVFAADLRHARKVIDELGLSRSKPVALPVMTDVASGCREDNHRLLDETEKKLYQRVVAKLNYLATDRLDSRYATSCLASEASAPSLGDLQTAKRVGRYLRKAQGCPFFDPRPGLLLCHAGADWASEKGFSAVDEWRGRDPWRWSYQLLGEETAECCAVELGERTVFGNHVTHTFTGNPKRVRRSWVQLQYHRCHRQPERHRSFATSRPECCIGSRWSEGVCG